MSSAALYSVVRVDLSEERTQPERYDVAGRELYAMRVPGPLQVRIGSPFAEPITISGPGRVVRCDDAIGAIWVTNAAGAGVAELVYSDAVTLDFPAAEGRSGAAPLLVQQLVPILSGTPRFLNGITGALHPVEGAAGQFAEYDIQGMHLWALHLNEPGSTAAAYHGYYWSLPCLAVFEAYRAGFPVPDVGIWRAEMDVVALETGTAKGAGARLIVGYAKVGGSGGYQARYGVYFAREGSSPDWVAVVNSWDPAAPSGPGVDLVRVPLGVSAEEPHRLAIDAGTRGGVPVISWLIDGQEVHRHEGALSGPIRFRPAEDFRWIVGAYRAGFQAYHGFNGFRALHWPGGMP